jgi:surfeit locus 1 family protein
MSRPPALRRAWGPALALLVLAGVFAGLGVWQVQRLAWKTRLIAATDAAVHAAPVDPATLPPGDLSALVYRRLAITGHFVPAGTTLVTGTSALGTGYWELVPLVGEDGHTVMINRGFLPQGSRIAAARARVPTGRVRIEGLLRLTEPHGTLLRANRPAQDVWYARDIAAIAARRGVGVDPRLFIDSWSENPAAGADAPVPGLTVIAFPNNHLGYALTWFTMGVMAIGGAVMLLRRR